MDGVSVTHTNSHTLFCLSLFLLSHLPLLQEVGVQVLHRACATAAGQLAAAAGAVSRLSAAQLAEGVADLAGSPADAPDALLSLLTCLRRCARGAGASALQLLGVCGS